MEATEPEATEGAEYFCVFRVSGSVASGLFRVAAFCAFAFVASGLFRVSGSVASGLFRVFVILRFHLYGLPRFQPCVPPTDQGSRLLPTCSLKFIRHTGAGAFACSGTVGDDPGLFGDLHFGGPFDNMVWWHANRPLRKAGVAGE
jgi:hypothetical protein